MSLMVWILITCTKMLLTLLNKPGEVNLIMIPKVGTAADVYADV